MINGITKGLIIKKKWLDMILAEKKTWEIRSKGTKTRGKVGLIESGSGLVVGECEIIGSFPVADRESLLECLHGISDFASMVKYKKPHAWVLRNVKRFNKPIPYKHPQGAVVWVNLEGRIGNNTARAL